MTGLRVLIADDEPLGRARLRRMLDDLGGHTCVGEAEDGPTTLAACASLQPHVVLLDVQMPGPDGLSVARTLRTRHPEIAVIFVTAHSEHAVQAFGVAAVHYLLKPVRLPQLADALSRVDAVARPEPAASTAPAFLRAQLRGRVELVPVESVRYFEADHKYVTAHTAARDFLLEDSLATLERLLGESFLRVHRKLLVSRAWIHEARRDSEGRIWLELTGGERIEVSRRRAPALRHALRQGGAPS